MEIKIRGLDDYTVNKIDQLALAKGLSREALLRNVCEELVEHEKISEINNKYQALMEKLLGVLKENTEQLKKNDYVLEKYL